MDDFDKLTRELEAEGFFKPDLGHVTFRVVELLTMFAVGFYLMLNGHMLLGLVIAGVAQGRCGWFMHEGGHYSLTGTLYTIHCTLYTIHHLLYIIHYTQEISSLTDGCRSSFMG